MLSGVVVRVSLLVGKYQLVYLYSASVPIMYLNANLCAPSKVQQVVTTHSTINHEFYVVPAKINSDGLFLMPFVTGLVMESQRENELLNFGYVAHW
jgi:hypothetical protein